MVGGIKHIVAQQKEHKLRKTIEYLVKIDPYHRELQPPL